jgi:hypothetical protein
MEWIVFWLLCLASVRVVKTAAVDAWVQITDKTREPPSLEERRIRAELAQQQASTTGAPGVGQAFADQIASWIANPPPRPAWLTELLGYLALLLSDAFANARRRHVARQREREQRDRGEQPRTGKRGSPYCWRCDVNHVDKRGDLCPSCAPVVKASCPGCGSTCPSPSCETDRARSARCGPARATPPAGERPGPTRLIIRG